MCCGSESDHGGGECGHHHRGRHHHGPRGMGHHHAPCACGRPFRFERRFWTSDEKRAWLQEYLETLRAEAKAVEEQIAEMKEGE